MTLGVGFDTHLSPWLAPRIIPTRSRLCSTLPAVSSILRLRRSRSAAYAPCRSPRRLRSSCTVYLARACRPVCCVVSPPADSRHLPPLSRNNFEEYLLFVERSPENLYFIQWLRDDSHNYEAWARGGTLCSLQLAISWLRGKKTFFRPHAHL
ncbi:hypothetical protein FRC08_016383 [Ceratobasidium sp. 394]|nr:hypothetical protein FRC08_016383 [Ceratobasidium sp. 394]